KDISVKGANILVLGITFKENCPDVRNTKVVDILTALKDYQTNITVYDPWAATHEVKHEYGWETTNVLPDTTGYDAVVLAVAHKEFENINIQKICKDNRVIY